MLERKKDWINIKNVSRGWSQKFELFIFYFKLEIQYLLMGKKPQKCLKNCQKHYFILKPVDYFAYISRDVQVSFCPPTLKHHPFFPVFNRDRKYYTSSFCLKEDQAKYHINDNMYKKEHEKFCNEQLKDKSEMLQPKPRSKVPYCHVCKDHYEDYCEHMKSQNHKTCIAFNKFTGYMNQLIKERYQQSQPIHESLSAIQEESYYNDKQINSNTTLPSNMIMDEHQQNHGFTFVSGQSVFELNGVKMLKQRRDSLLGDGLQKQMLSPQFQNLLRRCSTHTHLGSQKKSTTLTKFPIIVTPMQ